MFCSECSSKIVFLQNWSVDVIPKMIIRGDGTFGRWWEQSPHEWDWCLYKWDPRELLTPSTAWNKRTSLQPGRVCNHSSTLISDAQLPEQWEVNFCCLQGIQVCVYKVSFDKTAWMELKDILCSVFVGGLSPSSTCNTSKMQCDVACMISQVNLICIFLKAQEEKTKSTSGKCYQDKLVFKWENVCIRNC